MVFGIGSGEFKDMWKLYENGKELEFVI